MALRSVYERFLDAPSTQSLAENASLHYVTTLTSFSHSGPIIKHLESQNKKIVSTKSGAVIGVVEGPSALALEVETTLEFLSGGGSYLPGLENFVVDRTATIPTVRSIPGDRPD